MRIYSFHYEFLVEESMNCDNNIKQRIKTIYSHDGPGFREEVISSKEFTSIKNIPTDASILYSSLHLEK